MARPRSGARVRDGQWVRFAARVSQLVFAVLSVVHVLAYLPGIAAVIGDYPYWAAPIAGVLFVSMLLHFQTVRHGATSFRVPWWRRRWDAQQELLRLAFRNIPKKMLIAFAAVFVVPGLLGELWSLDSSRGDDSRQVIVALLVLAALPAFYFTYVAPQMGPHEMNACPRCAEMIPERSPFCPACGAQLER